MCCPVRQKFSRCFPLGWLAPSSKLNLCSGVAAEAVSNGVHKHAVVTGAPTLMHSTWAPLELLTPALTHDSDVQLREPPLSDHSWINAPLGHISGPFLPALLVSERPQRV